MGDISGLVKALSCSISHLGYHPSSCCFLVLELGIESLTTLTALLCSLPLSLRCFVWVVLLDGLLWLAGWVGFRGGGGGVGFCGVDRGGVRGFVGCGAMWLGAALSFYGNFPDIS